MAASHYPPLHDAHVLAPSGNQATIVKQEFYVGHMTAVSAINMTGSLEEEENQLIKLQSMASHHLHRLFSSKHSIDFQSYPELRAGE